MKRQLRALELFLALAFVASHLAVAGDKSPQSRLPVPRIEDLPSTRIDWAYDQTRLTALSDRTRRTSLAGVDVSARAAVPRATLADTLYLNPALLNLPSDHPVLGASTSVPRQIAHLQLTIGTEEFVLFVGDVTYDAAKEIRHVTAAVLNHANSYARFAVQDRTGMISGTIRTPQHTYRIVPYREGGQLAYRLGDTAGGVPARYRGVLTPTTGNPAALAVEDRHRMAELLADIQPWHVNFSKNEFMLTLVGGNIGRLEPDSMSPADIGDLLTRLSPLTRARGNENFEIFSITPRDDEAPGARAIEFRQVVNGIQINFDQEIIVDANGRIRQLLVGLVSPETVPARNVMTETDAWATAAQQLRDALAGEPVKQDGAGAELRYDRVGGQWTPVWRFAAVVSGRGSYFIDIDAGSGRARWWSADRRITGDDFRTAIFRTTSGTPDDRADAGATLVCQESNDADIGCDGELDRYLWPERISQKLNFDWETARGNDPYLCCMGVGAPSSAQGPPFQDEFLDIIIDTPAAMEGGWSPRYRATTATLLIPPQVPGYQYDYSKSADVIVHEHMHAYIHRANPSFHNHPADNSGAMNEGIADAMTGMFATRAQQGWEETWLGAGNPATGQAWVIGDSPVAPFPANLPDERSRSH